MTPTIWRSIIVGAGVWAACAAPALADDAADKLMKEAATTAATAKSLRATLTVSQKAGGSAMSSTGTVKLVKPNRALIVMKGGPFATTIASDGKNVINLMQGNQYIKMPADPNGRNISVAWAFPVTMFFDIKGGLGQLGNGPVTYGGKETVNGRAYDVLVKSEGDNTFKLFIGPEKIVTRVTIDIKQEQQVIVLGAELADIKLNAPIPAADLAFTLPATAKLYKQPDFNAKLIPVGKLAEKFDLIALKGDYITLDDAARGKKAVLVNFWFYG